VQAHPFRQRFYINRIILSTHCVDAVEVANGGHEDVSNDALACRYAKYIGKPMVAGTDGHDTETIYYNEHFGVYSDVKFKTINDYVNMILNNKVTRIKIDEGRLDFHGNETVRLPVEIRDKNDKITGRHWKEVIFDD
ncbi:MAG: histidinol-phosphatase, partial [Treponema sp.]|nr:histidinol-phosphatase [Treponema sp.]